MFFLFGGDNSPVATTPPVAGLFSCISKNYRICVAVSGWKIVEGGPESDQSPSPESVP